MKNSFFAWVWVVVVEDCGEIERVEAFGEEEAAKAFSEFYKKNYSDKLRSMSIEKRRVCVDVGAFN